MMLLQGMFNCGQPKRTVFLESSNFKLGTCILLTKDNVSGELYQNESFSLSRIFISVVEYWFQEFGD